MGKGQKHARNHKQQIDKISFHSESKFKYVSCKKVMGELGDL